MSNPGTYNNEKLRTTIKRLLKARGLSQADLAKKLEVSSATVKRALNTEDLSVERLSRIAEAVGIDFFELVRLADDFEVEGMQMSEEQEEFLVEKPQRAHILWRLTNGFSPATIARDANVSVGTVRACLKDLTAMNLVDNVNGTYRSALRWPFGFRFKGPLHKAFGRHMFDRFVEHLYQQVEDLEPPLNGPYPFSLKMIQFIVREKTYQKYREEHTELITKYLGISRLERSVEKETDLRTASVLYGSDLVDAAADAFGPLQKQTTAK